MKYDILLQDKRCFLKLYSDYIKLNHPIVNAFYTVNKKKLRIVKISLFFMSILIEFSLNAFFYNDSDISKKFQNKGETSYGTVYFPYFYQNNLLFPTGKIISHCYFPYMIELQAIGSINYLYK